MSKDYQICLGNDNAYICKVNKKDKTILSNERKPISKIEILYLIYWWIKKRVKEN